MNELNIEQPSLSPQGPMRKLRVRDRLRGKAFLVPNLITVTGIFCGFLSIIFSIRGDFAYAARCIALAIILDGLDGRIARRLNACSPFGLEFDSLSDQVAFGVAPAVLAYQWAFANTAEDFGILVSFLVVACAATRLARFNITSLSPSPSRQFQGLPSPGAAAAIASFVYLVPEAQTSAKMVTIAMCYTVLVSVLMVSSIPYPSVKHIKLKATNPRLILAILSAAVAFTWYNIKLVIFLGCVIYVLSGFIMWFWLLRQNGLKGSTDPDIPFKVDDINSDNQG